MEDNIFDYIDSILYKKSLKDLNIDHSTQYSPYLINRWLSMYSSDIANIINCTVNSYGNVLSKEEHYKFLSNLISKSSRKKISYIKKPKQDLDNDVGEIEDIANIMELSEREIAELIDLESQLNK